jgi:pimeloyl-ACP methyl ester carboxylesterase
MPTLIESRFEAFRAAHPPIHVPHPEPWTYIRGGGEGPAVLLLGGALGVAEFAFTAITALERKARVIAPDYPAAPDLDSLVRGLAAVLDHAGVDRAVVAGGSYGGLVAQAFARLHPERTHSLILSHTGAPRPMRGRRWAVRLLDRVPEVVLRALLRRRLATVLRGADPFWLEQFHAIVSGLSGAAILSRVRIAAEAGDRFGSEPLGPVPYPVLIVEADDDPFFPPAERAALHRLYPGAEVHTFHGTGHLAAVVASERFASVLLDFMSRHGAPGQREP